MELKLGSLEFDATPYAPRVYDVPLHLMWSKNRHFLANLDYQLVQKEALTVYAWDCRTEMRQDLDAQDRLRIETDLTLFVPRKVKNAIKGEPPANDPRKSKAMAFALAKECGFSDPDKLNEAIQATLATFTEKAPVNAYKALLYPHSGFIIHADIEYAHMRLKVPGRRLNGFVFLSLPIGVTFHMTPTGRCPGAKKKKWTDPPREKIRPLIGTSLTALAFAKAGFERYKAGAEHEIKRLQELMRETLAEETDESLSEKAKKKEQKFREYLADVYRKAAGAKWKDLETMQDALKARTEELGKD